MPLLVADRPSFRRSLRPNVAVTLAGLKLFVGRARWIGKNNRYGRDTVGRLKRDVIGPERSRQLAQYIAASSILHCSDGWSYLGKALAAYLAGDPHRGLHFGVLC